MKAPKAPGARIGELTYEELLAEGSEDFGYGLPDDEWDALALNYLGYHRPTQGVVYSHRGAWTNAVNNVVTWAMPHHPIYLWTLPLFHCNGWCFPWPSPCWRAPTCLCAGQRPEAFIRPLPAPCHPSLRRTDHHVDDCRRQRGERRPGQQVRMTAAAPPPTPVIAAMEAMGIAITHVYGLTEVYGPAWSVRKSPTGRNCPWTNRHDSRPAGGGLRTGGGRAGAGP